MSGLSVWGCWDPHQLPPSAACPSCRTWVVDAGVRWNQDQWDDANTRALLAEVPSCELSAEELRKLLEVGRVPDHLKAELGKPWLLFSHLPRHSNDP